MQKAFPTTKILIDRCYEYRLNENNNNFNAEEKNFAMKLINSQSRDLGWNMERDDTR